MNRKTLLTALGAIVLTVVAASSAMAVNLGILDAQGTDNVGEMEVGPVATVPPDPATVDLGGTGAQGSDLAGAPTDPVVAPGASGALVTSTVMVPAPSVAPPAAVRTTPPPALPTVPPATATTARPSAAVSAPTTSAADARGRGASKADADARGSDRRRGADAKDDDD